MHQPPQAYCLGSDRQVNLLKPYLPFVESIIAWIFFLLRAILICIFYSSSFIKFSRFNVSVATHFYTGNANTQIYSSKKVVRTIKKFLSVNTYFYGFQGTLHLLLSATCYKVSYQPKQSCPNHYVKWVDIHFFCPFFLNVGLI